MSDGLKRFSKRLTVFALIKSGVYSLSLGVIVFATLLVLHKREAIPLAPWLSLLISVGVVGVTFGILFIIQRPTPKRTARIIDEEFSLGERAQTMLAYSGKEGAMLEMQRIDTEGRIAAIPDKALRFKRMWASIVAIGLALVMTVIGIAVPTMAEDAPEIPIIDGYEKNWRIAELKQLIARVEADKFAEEELRTAIIEEINDLILAVEATDEEPTIKASAIRSVGVLSSLITDFNSADEISKALLGASDEAMVAMGNAIAKLSDSGFSDALEDMIDAISSAPNATNAASLLLGKLNSALASVEIADTDGLYSSLRLLSNAIASSLDSGSSDIAGELVDVCEAVGTATSVAFLQQSDNLRISNIVISEIMRIFSISRDELIEEGVEPPPIVDTEKPVTPPEGENDDELTGDNTGGYGSGDNMVGSDDSVYDPDLDLIIKYKDVINKYYAIFDNQYDDIPPQIAEIARKYFDLLVTPEDM